MNGRYRWSGIFAMLSQSRQKSSVSLRRWNASPTSDVSSPQESATMVDSPSRSVVRPIVRAPVSSSCMPLTMRNERSPASTVAFVYPGP